ncbi:MAG: hypothetical protein SVE93_05505 [Candidatus Thermoplasmatota archaeon]|nr:hypothetical protein [Candidatus Thermoplasmatota archaeon]
MIRIEADGEEVVINEFVQKLIEDVIMSMVKNLKGAENAMDVSIFIESD